MGMLARAYTPADSAAGRRRGLAGYDRPIFRMENRAPERLVAEYKRRFDTHDLAGLVELRTRSCAIVDHRRRRSERDGDGEYWQPEFASTDVRIELDELLACDERVIAVRAVVRGTVPDDGAMFELRFGAVDVVESGRFTSVELYDPDDRPAMLARYVELAGRRAP
jgi:SnoaL-like domain